MTSVSLTGNGHVLFSTNVARRVHLLPRDSMFVAIPENVRVRRRVPYGAVERQVVVLRAVQFANGGWWVANAHNQGTVPDSVTSGLLSAVPAHLRLAAAFRRGGIAAVERELGYAGKP